MERIIFALSLTLFFNFESFATSPELLSRYFKKVPLEEAHVFYGQPKENVFNSDSIKVLVWNIKKTQEAAWKEEFLKFSKNRELFLLQEAYPNQLFSTTLSSFENVRWDMGISFKYVLYDYLPTGTMLGSKVWPSEVIVKHTPDYEPATDTPKALTIGKYPLDRSNHQLLVISVHGINFTDLSSFKRNMGQIEEEVANHNGPILIAGDFNTRTQARTKYLFGLMGKLGLREVTFKNAHQRMKAVMTNYYLDYGFVRGLAVKNAEVLGYAKGSDHKPMLLEISMTEK